MSLNTQVHSTQTQVQCQRLQADQFEILSYIYLDQFHMLKQHYPYKFSILCRPYLKSHQHEYQLSIHFEFSKTYPKTPIHYDIQPISGITRDNMNQITKRIQDLIYQNRGKSIVYDVVQQIRLWVSQYLVEGRAYESFTQVQKKIDQVFQRPKFAAFTPVTVQNFLVWKKDFEFRTKAKKIQKKQVQIKLSGKQWFLGKKEEEIIDSEDEEDSQDEDDEFVEDEEQEIKNFQEPVNKLFMMDQEETLQQEISRQN